MSRKTIRHLSPIQRKLAEEAKAAALAASSVLRTPEEGNNLWKNMKVFHTAGFMSDLEYHDFCKSIKEHYVSMGWQQPEI